MNDPGGPRCDGVTPLMDAAGNGHVDVVQLLVERGADPRMKDIHVGSGGRGEMFKAAMIIAHVHRISSHLD